MFSRVGVDFTGGKQNQKEKETTRLGTGRHVPRKRRARNNDPGTNNREAVQKREGG